MRFNNKIAIIFPIIIFLNLKFGVVKIEGSSMNPTLYDNDICLYYKTTKLKRFDIILVKHSKNILIKRVIGLNNENVEYKNNKLYIDGFLKKEDYQRKVQTDFLTKIKKGYFLMGDNRDKSIDSRRYGTFDINNVIGRVLICSNS